MVCEKYAQLADYNEITSAVYEKEKSADLPVEQTTRNASTGWRNMAIDGKDKGEQKNEAKPVTSNVTVCLWPDSDAFCGDHPYRSDARAAVPTISLLA